MRSIGAMSCNQVLIYFLRTPLKCVCDRRGRDTNVAVHVGTVFLYPLVGGLLYKSINKGVFFMSG